MDELTGERQAKFVKSKLEYLDDKKRYPEVDISKKIICSGQLKSNRGPVSLSYNIANFNLLTEDMHD